MLRVLFRLILSLTLIGFVALGVGYWYLDKNLNQPLDYSKQNFEIKKGDSLAAISERLYAQKIMPDRFSFKLLGRYQNAASSLKPGDYEIESDLTAQQILDKFIQGEVVTHKVSLVEGLTFKQFRARLANHQDLIKRTAKMSDAQVMAALGAADVHPEGQFFPDTYVFRASESDLDILQQAYDRMQQQLAHLWSNRDDDTPLENSYQALILASIIEKETGQADERPIIGGVFTNRLNRGMLLQTDPTIIYGLGDAFNGNITKRHLNSKENIYNTYQHAGLPPTPIAMPGLAALKAAVNPQKTKHIYFVAKGDGSHQFSETYQQHLKAVREYQLKRRNKG